LRKHAVYDSAQENIDGELGVATGINFREVWQETREQFGIPQDAAPTLNMIPRLATDPVGMTVYLDLNHWIGLAKARKAANSSPTYDRCYELLKAATSDRKVSMPLSSATYMELQHAVRSPRQRGDLADVMSELSRFVTIRRRSELIDAQFEAALNRRFGRPIYPRKLEAFGIGFNFAFEGVEKRMQIYMSDGVPARPADGAFFVFGYLAGELTEYLMLRGPRDQDLSALAATGYDRGPALAVEQERLERELRLAEDLRQDSRWLQRLDDVVWARELYWEIGPRLPELMGLAGMTEHAFFRYGKEWITEFLEDLPSVAVQQQIRRQLFAKGSRPWKINDIRDLDALSLAIPYCDVVVTDKEAVGALTGNAGVERSGTVLLARPEELLERLGEA